MSGRRHPFTVPGTRPLSERSSRALSHHRFRHLLRRGLHGAVAPRPVCGSVEGVHGAGQLRLLRLVGLALHLPPGRVDGHRLRRREVRPPGHGHPETGGHVDHRGDAARAAGLVQVLRVRRRQRRQPHPRRRARSTDSPAHDHASGRYLLLHLHGHQLCGRHLPRGAPAGAGHRHHGVPRLLPPPDRGTDRPWHRAPTADPQDAGPVRRPLRRGVLAHRRGTGQEGGPLLLPVDLRRRPGLRRPAAAFRPRGPVRHLGIRRPDLRRLQRLHRYRHRPGTAHGIPVPGQLPATVHGHRPPGLLATVAHHPLVLAA